MRYGSFLTVSGLGFVFAVACGGSDSGGTAQSPCVSVCNCVANLDATARTQCMTDCNNIVSSKPPDPVATCESELQSRGYNGCTGNCQAFKQSSSSGGIQCTQSGADGTVPACTAQSMPRKLSCSTASDQSVALQFGCVKEHPETATDYDVCCPATVGGGSGGGSGIGGGTGVGGLGSSGAQGAGGFDTASGGFLGIAGSNGTGGFVGIAGSNGTGGFVEGAGGFVSAGGFQGLGGAFGTGGSTSCDPVNYWLTDCATTIDCSCGFSCVHTCSSCNPGVCARACRSDADCIGATIGTLATAHCFVNDPAFQGWCSSN